MRLKDGNPGICRLFERRSQAKTHGVREYMQDHVEDYSPDFPMSMT